jgi:hypothetical protein
MVLLFVLPHNIKPFFGSVKTSERLAYNLKGIWGIHENQLCLIYVNLFCKFFHSGEADINTYSHREHVYSNKKNKFPADVVRRSLNV